MMLVHAQKLRDSRLVTTDACPFYAVTQSGTAPSSLSTSRAAVQPHAMTARHNVLELKAK